jgi:hypothetical protein
MEARRRQANFMFGFVFVFVVDYDSMPFEVDALWFCVKKK